MNAAQTPVKPISRSDWVNFVSRFSADGPELQPRRSEVRRDLNNAFARVVYSEGQSPKRWVERSCAILQISNEGLMVRSHQPIEMHTRMAIEAVLGDDVIRLIGTVRHCTLTVGAFKIGVELQFG